MSALFQLTKKDLNSFGFSYQQQHCNWITHLWRYVVWQMSKPALSVGPHSNQTKSNLAHGNKAGTNTGTPQLVLCTLTQTSWAINWCSISYY